MDLNRDLGDTTLSLDCFGYESRSRTYGLKSVESKRGDGQIPPSGTDDGCRLVLGLGPSPTTYSNDFHNHRRVNEGKGSVSFGDNAILKLGLSGGTEDVSGLFEYSVSTQTKHIPLVDEGSTSAKKSGGYMPSLLFAPKVDNSIKVARTQDLLEIGTKSTCNPSQFSPEPSGLSDYSISTISQPARTSSSKKCRFEGCLKGARGSTGLCIGHGGGQRCQKPGCNKGAESRTAYCKAHGGGKRCDYLGCTKSAEGRTDYCIGHGGGRRCCHPEGCTKAARGKSGLCIKHGGGKRCTVDGCSRSAEGKVGLCISHGGGRRCQFTSCTKGAQGGTNYCKAHGGGKRCVFAGCTKGAEGSTPLCKAHGGGKRCMYDGGGICPKSVHGGTNFCVAHGGGKRCSVAGCTKSARGRTDCCVRHGGGKRCRFENCGKSAQGSTDFCKAHGGGKRCSWGEGKCDKFARGRNGLCASHSSLAQERETSKSGMLGPGLFHGLVPATSTVGSSYENNYSSSGLSFVSDTTESSEKPAKRQHLIPSEVLVPFSMKSSSSYSRPSGSEKQGKGERDGGNACSSGRGFDLVVPEGRVHGGGLMSMLGGNFKNAIDGI